VFADHAGGRGPVDDGRAGVTGRLQQRLAADEVLFGAVLNMTNTTMVEVCCAAGADFLFLDFEHGLKDYSSIAEGLIAAELHGVPTLVRIGERSPDLVARMLDGGATGILFPHVSSATEAEDLVSWCRYAPLGKRGSGFSRAGLRNGNEYDRRQQASRDVVCMMIVEDLEGAKDLPAILAVDGVTGVAIGPGDLSMQLGVDDWNHPAVREVLDGMAATVAACPGKALMRLSLTPAAGAANVASGTNMVLLTHDVHLVGAMYRQTFDEFASAVPDRPGRTTHP